MAADIGNKIVNNLVKEAKEIQYNFGTLFMLLVSDANTSDGILSYQNLLAPGATDSNSNEKWFQVCIYFWRVFTSPNGHVNINHSKFNLIFL